MGANVLDSFGIVELDHNQAEFVAKILRSDSQPRYRLVAAPGSGKSMVMLFIVAQIIAELDATHILFLDENAGARDYFAHVLTGHTGSIPLRKVSIQTLRELAASVEVGRSPWENPIVALSQPSLVTRADVGESLFDVTWDLIVVDDVYRQDDALEGLLRQLTEAGQVRRLVIATSSPSAELFPTLKLALRNWSMNLSDQDGQQLFRPPPVVQVVPYERDGAEVEFLTDLLDLLSQGIPSRASGVQTLLQQQAASSLYAIEQGLLRHRNRLAHNAPDMYQAEESEIIQDDQLAQLDGGPARSDVTPDIAMARISELLDSLDKIPEDAKLKAFLALIDRLVPEVPFPNIFVFCTFAASASYLHTSLQEKFRDVFLITGSTSGEEQSHLFLQFAKRGGITVITSAALTGLDIVKRQIDSVVNYDVPSSPIDLMRRAAVLTVGNPVPQSKMFFFDDTTGVLPTEATALEAARRTLREAWSQRI